MNRRDICRRLVIVVAAAFLISAWLYTLATIHIAHDRLGRPEVSPLIALFRDHGAAVLLAELALLALATVGMVYGERSTPARGKADSADKRAAADQQQGRSSAGQGNERGEQGRA